MAGASELKGPQGFYPWIEPVDAGESLHAPTNLPKDAPQGSSDPAASPEATPAPQTPPPQDARPSLRQDEPAPVAAPSQTSWDDSLDAVHTVARIAVVDDMACAPRVVTIEPAPVRDYVEELTRTTYSLAKEQGGTIPFMVIREVVENLIHAYFSDPVVTIFPGGNTIRFSDRGPGIADKTQAMEYGTTTATPAMKRYIRGVGSGLPYVFHFLDEKGGTLTLDDNLSKGTVVTISLGEESEASSVPPAAAPVQGEIPATAGAPFTGTPAAPYPAPGYAFPGYPPSGEGTGAPFAPPYPSPMAPAAAQGALTANAGGYPAAPGYPAAQGYPAYGSPLGTPPAASPYPGWPATSYPAQSAQPAPGAFAQGPGGSPLASPGPQNPLAPSLGQPLGAQPANAQPLGGQPAATPAGQPALPQLDEVEQSILAFLAIHSSVGPTDLTNVYGRSLATWTRRLKTLETKGVLEKDGQKRRLTALGQALIAQLMP